MIESELLLFMVAVCRRDSIGAARLSADRDSHQSAEMLWLCERQKPDRRAQTLNKVKSHIVSGRWPIDRWNDRWIDGTIHATLYHDLCQSIQ